jgi:glucosamine--fructose-6-phosphate aminotransferase (isomerizing)
MRKTIREILFQPKAWANTIRRFSEQRTDLSNYLKGYEEEEIILTGCGTSYYLSLAGSALYTEFTGRRSMGVPASEIMFFPGSVFAKGKKYLLVPVSRSGKTPETLSAIRYVKDVVRGGTLLISCTENSEMGAYSDFSIVCPEAAEETKYMTKSFTSMLLGFQLLTAFTAGNRYFEEELAQLPDYGERIIMKHHSSLENLANSRDFNLYIYLGQGSYYGLAAESMLKIKEMACTPAEAYHGMEFMHGPKYAVDSKTLIVYILSDSVKDQEIGLLKRIKDLGGHIMVICDEYTPNLAGIAGDVVELNCGLSESARHVLIMLITQLYGYYRALAVGKDLE